MRLSEPPLREELHEELRAPWWRSLRLFVLPAIVALVMYAFYAVGGYGDKEPPPKPARPGSIYGTVMDEQQRPIQGATVTISFSSSKEAVPDGAPATDAQGHFYLPDLPIGIYILQATAAGFEMQTQKTSVDPGKTTQLKLPLYRTPVRTRTQIPRPSHRQ